MTAVVLATVVLPLIRRARRRPSARAFDRAVYRDQLRELERDAARGLIGAAEAATARLEIERRLLAADAAATPRRRAGAGGAALAVVLALLVRAAAARALSRARLAGRARPALCRARARARAAAATRPSDREERRRSSSAARGQSRRCRGWLRWRAPSGAAAIGRRAPRPIASALRSDQDRPDIAAAYGEMLVMARGRHRHAGGARCFRHGAGRRSRATRRARYYLALAEAQAGNAEAAIDAWQRLAAETPGGRADPHRAEARIAEARARGRHRRAAARGAARPRAARQARPRWPRPAKMPPEAAHRR